jgi:hypothetical protein
MDAAEIERLQQQVAERDQTIQVMKDKTKAYIQKLTSDHEAALKAKEDLLQAEMEVVYHHLLFYSKPSMDPEL